MKTGDLFFAKWYIIVKIANNTALREATFKVYYCWKFRVSLSGMLHRPVKYVFTFWELQRKDNKFAAKRAIFAPLKSISIKIK